MNTNPCANCASDCGTCAPCCAGPLLLTRLELTMLQRFGESPFLPVARNAGDETPVYLEDETYPRDQYAAVLRNLEAKGLISLDYHLPLANFDYTSYAAYPLHGSMALTAAGQDALESLDVQGAEE